MSYTITSQCIECDRCLSLCPMGAIQKQNGRLSIDASICNNCAGHYSVAQCAAVCPTNGGCVPGATTIFNQLDSLKNSTDYWDRWFSVYDRMIVRLKDSKQSPYWESWFDAYSHQLAKVLHTKCSLS